MKKLPNVSASRSIDLACPKRYHQMYALKMIPDEGFSQSLVYGSCCHSALKAVANPVGYLSVGNRDIGNLIRTQFSAAPYPNDHLRLEDLARALPTIENYWIQDQDKGATVGVEIFQDFKTRTEMLNTLAYSAKFDRLLVRPAAPTCLVIRDYKTGQVREVDLRGAAIMLAVAKVNLRRMAVEYQYPLTEVVLEYDYLSTEGLAKRVVIHLSDIKLIWQQIVAEAMEIYNATDFPPRPGEHCLFCSFRKDCQPDITLDAADLFGLFETSM